VNRFLILLAVLTMASLGQSYREEASPDDFRLQSPQEARELDPEYNLDVLNADALRAYYAAWDGFNCIYRGFAPQIVTMSDYWRENYDRQTQRRVHDFCEPKTKGTNPFGYLYIQAYNIRSLKITQILNDTVFVHVTGRATLSTSLYSTLKMDWDLGFEDLRSDHPKLTVFWETSVRKLDYELHDMWRKERVEREYQEAQDQWLEETDDFNQQKSEEYWEQVLRI
jgi:hypothetical protein